MRHFLCALVLCVLAPFAAAQVERVAPPEVLAAGQGVHVAAEWEPATGVIIGWPLNLPRDLVIALARDVDLYVTVKDKAHEQAAGVAFADWSIPAQRVHFVRAQGISSAYSRDWGPFAVFDAAGKYHLVDGVFHGYPVAGLDSGKGLLKLPGQWSLANDAAPAAVAEALGVPRTELPVALTGGNVYFDGLGTAFATQILADENLSMGVSKDRFLRLARHALGVKQFHFLPNFASKPGIQHIDCLLKLLDEERILVKRAPPDHPDFPNIEVAVQALSRLTNVYGRPYTILRLDTPRYKNDLLANYTNSLILNRKVYVPLFGIPADEQALATFRTALPGYEVLGFLHSKGYGWNYKDALHCRTRAVWDTKMLLMTHKRPAAVVAPADKVAIEVHIRDYSSAGLAADKLRLTWRTAGGAKWTDVPLKPVGPKYAFAATIEGLAPGQTVEYYLSAAALSGRQETLPRTAPRGFYSFAVGQKR